MKGRTKISMRGTTPLRITALICRRLSKSAKLRGFLPRSGTTEESNPVWLPPSQTLYEDLSFFPSHQSDDYHSLFAKKKQSESSDCIQHVFAKKRKRFILFHPGRKAGHIT